MVVSMHNRILFGESRLYVGVHLLSLSLVRAVWTLASQLSTFLIRGEKKFVALLVQAIEFYNIGETGALFEEIRISRNYLTKIFSLSLDWRVHVFFFQFNSNNINLVRSKWETLNKIGWTSRIDIFTGGEGCSKWNLFKNHRKWLICKFTQNWSSNQFQYENTMVNFISIFTRTYRVGQNHLFFFFLIKYQNMRKKFGILWFVKKKFFFYT